MRRMLEKNVAVIIYIIYLRTLASFLIHYQEKSNNNIYMFKYSNISYFIYENLYTFIYKYFSKYNTFDIIPYIFCSIKSRNCVISLRNEKI